MQFISNIDMWRSDRTSNYQGLLTSIRGTVRGVTLNVNHTWSHCIAERMTLAIANPNQSPHHVDTKDRANCDQDRRHIFNLTAVASSPEFTRPALKALASGWQISIINRIASGAPVTISAGADRALTGLAGQAANQVLADVYMDKSADRVNEILFIRAAFAPPDLGAYGNMGFLSLRGLSSWSLDAALTRQFALGESQRVEVRAFNSPNAVRANTPISMITNINFGRITFRSRGSCSSR
jgi:hypothetical protein